MHSQQAKLALQLQLPSCQLPEAKPTNAQIRDISRIGIRRRREHYLLLPHYIPNLTKARLEIHWQPHIPHSGRLNILTTTTVPALGAASSEVDVFEQPFKRTPLPW